MHASEVRLIPRATDLAEYASDLAAVCRENGERMTARDLAESYLDQNLAEGQDFDAAVAAYTATCEYYA